MRKGRKFLCLLLCAVLLLSMSAAALGANNNYSSWFQTNYDEINKLGLMPASFNGLDLTKDITRGEMCELAVYAFEKATGNDIDMSNETFTGFTDTSDENIVKAHLYGIVNGYEDGSFRPKQLLTRQEFFKLIENFCVRTGRRVQQHDRARMDARQEFRKGLLLRRLIVLIPVDIGKAPKYRPVAWVICHFEIFLTVNALRRAVIFFHDLARRLLIERLHVGKLLPKACRIGNFRHVVVVVRLISDNVSFVYHPAHKVRRGLEIIPDDKKARGRTMRL